jgi:hypothetical protein
MFLRTLISICLIASALAVAGCGGGDSTLTKAEYIKQAETICKRINDQREEAIQAFTAKSSAGPGNPITVSEQLKLVLDVALPPVQQEAEELDELGDPEGAEAEAEAIVDGLENGVDKVEQNPTIVLKEPTNPFNKTGELARKFGLENCAGF